MEKRKLLLSISIVAVITFLIIHYFNISEINEQSIQIRNDTRERQNEGSSPFPPVPFQPIPIQYRLWLSPLVLLIAVIPLSYYFISKRLETKLEKNMKVILKLISKNGVKETANNLKTRKDSTEIDKSAIFKLLNFNERKVLEKLIEKNGEILQSEISRMEGMNKLKTHRAMRNLELKGVIKTESYGKTRRVVLSKDIMNIMLK